MHEIIFNNGDKICLSDKGNTYIGDIANQYGHVFRRNKTPNNVILDWFQRQSGYLPISNIFTINQN